MKRLLLVFSLLILTLAASCAQAGPAPSGESTQAPGPAIEPASPQTPPVSPASAPTATSPGVALNPAAESSEGEPDAPIPDLSWDPAGPLPLISGTFCCGFTSAEYVRNYVPEFQVWGDGRYIWVSHAEDGSRTVMESRLGAEELSAVLSRTASDGFFGWKERYANDAVADVADKCITIRLLRVEKQVCEYYEGAPPAFHRLFEDLAGGLDQKGHAYFPTRGFLLLSVFDADFVTPTLVWQDSALKLAEVSPKGAWIVGEALTRLWEALNRQPWGPVVAEGDANYLYTIQIDGLSLEAPPAPW